MNKRKIIIIGLVVLAIAVSIFLFTNDKSAPEGEEVVTVLIPKEEALDVTMEFFDQWLTDTKSTTTDPFQSGLIASSRLSAEVRKMIEDKHATKIEGELDPVTCQTTIPDRLGGKEIFKSDTEAQIMVLARGFETKSPYQTIVTLKAVDGLWNIAKIECTQGEVPPEREYDFERDGYLLKSVPPPLNSEYWYLVYEEAGKPGHTLALFFDAESICVQPDGLEVNCDPNTFVEPAKVFLQADMLDTGADVRRVTFE